MIGYLITFHPDAPDDGEEFACFRRRLGRGFLYINQVAIDAHRRRGLGRSFYEHVARLARGEALAGLLSRLERATSTTMFEPRLIESRPEWLDADGIKLYTISAQGRRVDDDGYLRLSIVEVSGTSAIATSSSCIVMRLI